MSMLQDELLVKWSKKFDELIEVTDHFEFGSDVRQILLKDKEDYLELLALRQD